MKFIRVRGRVIPIREDKAKNAGLLAGAVAIAGAGGKIAGGKIRRAERAHQMAFDFGMNNPDTHANITKTLSALKAARKRLHTAKRFSVSSRFIASGLGAIAIHGLLKKEKDSGIKEAVKIAGAVAVSEVGSRAMYAGFKNKSFFNTGIKFSHGFKTAGLDLLKKAVKAKIK